MYQKIINLKTKHLLETLDKVKELKDFYLAGGTALALQLGHRKSIGLNFFSKKKVSLASLKKRLSLIGNFKIDSEDEKTLNCRIDEVKLSFFIYPYKTLFKFKYFKGFKVADERDIGCMKIDAISSRGAKKDFIDLYFLLKKYSFQDILNLFDKKYKGIKYSRLHILKSLVYFEEAEKEPMPIIIKKISWLEVKNSLKKEVKRIF